VWCGVWYGVVCSVWYGVVCAAMCGVVCGACRVWCGVWCVPCVVWCVVRAVCGVVCGVESTPIIVFPKSCVNTYEGCFERPAVLKKEDIPNIRQTAIHP